MKIDKQPCDTRDVRDSRRASVASVTSVTGKGISLENASSKSE
jgi:hypothetical protein